MVDLPLKHNLLNWSNRPLGNGVFDWLKVSFGIADWLSEGHSPLPSPYRVFIDWLEASSNTESAYE